MARENVEAVQRLIEAWKTRDIEAIVACHHPDAEFLLPRNVLEGGSYRGHAGIRRAWADVFDTWQDVRIEIQEIRAAADCVVALGRTVNVGKGDAPTVEYESAYLFRIRDGKVAYSRPYQSHQEALEAAGLRG